MAFLLFVGALLVFWIIVAIIGKYKSLNETNSSLFSNSVLPPNVNSQSIVRFGKIFYQTKSLNKLLLNISKKGKKFWQIWFSVGVIFGFFAIALSTLILLASFSISLYSLVYSLTNNNNKINIPNHPMVSVEFNKLSNVGNSNLEFNNTQTFQNNTFQFTNNEDNFVSIKDDLIVLKTFSENSIIINKTQPISYDNYIKSLVYGNWNENYEYEESFTEHTAKKYNQFLVSVIPGINLPLCHIGYYILAVFLSGIIHEFGHAIAALIEHVSVYSTGSFLYIIFPGAFVNMDDHLLLLLKPFNQLRIFCAGVWHNVWLCIICYLLLISMPIWLYIGYSHSNNELYVLDVNKNSPLYGYINKGSVIHTINDQPIPYGKDGFEIILRQSLIKNPINNLGYCISKDLYENNDNSCCNVSLEKPLSSSNLQCFEHHEALLDLYEVYMNEKTFNVERSGPYIPVPPIKSKCTNFINVIKNSPKCYVDSDCKDINYIKQKRLINEYNSTNNTSSLISNALIRKREVKYEDLSQKEYFENLHSYDTQLDSYCMTPYIPNPFMRVIKFQINDYPKDHHPYYQEVIFLSDPREVWDSVKVGNYFPRFRFLPFFIPYMIEYTIKYTISLSAALSILNMVPAYNMDGYHAFFAIMVIIKQIYTRAKKKLPKLLLKERRFRQIFSVNFYVSLINNEEEVNEELLNTSNDTQKKNIRQYFEKLIPLIYTLLLAVAIIAGIVGALSGNSHSLV
ncbi:hypothetical protein BCR36DRAFT_402262 [Piromyces finnis]|uniref:Endopeptidase S2P n=1 Tax=Piromyces finnis TaxID=1754191 RepID=A0A1Y1VJP6_9FUNG|nr:hypothetical protein BCR36DRAFT_402262 [Piromyces finnis]|eukprot:ORX57904.1 hypothetical protein BCR36DRAFT_402262 [Piromyces finnis]